MSNQLTEEQFKQVLPKQMQRQVNPVLINEVNTILAHNPEAMESYRDNLISYTYIMKEGKFKLSQYLDAVRYVTFKLGGSTNRDAYIRTFPDRYQKFIANGTDEKDIASYITSYNKNKLVNLIWAQTITPDYIINHDVRQRAINKLAWLMDNAESQKVQSDSAGKLLTELKPPETTKVELEVSNKEDSVIASLREATERMVAQQQQSLQAKVVNPKDIAEQSLVIEGELVS